MGIDQILEFFEISLLMALTSLSVWLVPSCRSSYQFYGNDYTRGPKTGPF